MFSSYKLSQRLTNCSVDNINVSFKNDNYKLGKILRKRIWPKDNFLFPNLYILTSNKGYIKTVGLN